jgi:hypothetical protein
VSANSDYVLLDRGMSIAVFESHYDELEWMMNLIKKNEGKARCIGIASDPMRAKNSC